jgi:hypothetical protein
VGLAQLLEAAPDRRFGHALEVEGGKPSQDIFLELAEAVGVIEWHGNDLEVGVHPGRHLRFVDGLLTASVDDNRS